jgi:exopolysaccharide production protein ExoZ
LRPASAKTAQPPRTPSVPKLVLLQVLRALAALSVAMLHAQHDAAAVAARGGRGFAPLDAFPWAAGVDVFFVISGFIMVHASGRLFGTPEGRRVFLARRVARIVPIYWAVTTAYLAVAFLAPALLNAAFVDWDLVLASYLFIPVTRPDGLVQPLVGLGWTLNYEMFFYALFAFAVAWPRRIAVLGLGAGVVGLVLLGRLLHPLPQPFGFWTAPVMLEFVYGMALALLHGRGLRLPGPTRTLLAAAAVLLLVVGEASYREEALAWRHLLYGVPAALLVAAVAFGRERATEGRLARLGAAVGDASYALYLVHPFVIRAGREAVLRSGLAPAIGPWAFVALALAGAVVASLLVYRFFERPLTAALRASLKA